MMACPYSGRASPAISASPFRKVEQVNSIAQFHSLQFGMLGNEFDSIFWPSALLIVEGESDITFLARVLAIHIPPDAWP